jgi:hypothetical protein
MMILSTTSGIERYLVCMTIILCYIFAIVGMLYHAIFRTSPIMEIFLGRVELFRIVISTQQDR